MKTLGSYWRFLFRPHLWQASVIVFLTVAVAVFEMATVGLGVPLLDTITKLDQATQNPIVRFSAHLLNLLGQEATTHSLVFFLLAIICLSFVLRSGLLVAQLYVTTYVAQKLRIKIKSQLFSKILHAEYEYLTGKSRGAILYDMNGPSQTICPLILTVGRLLTEFFTVLLMIGLMLYLSWWATVCIGVVAVFWIRGWRRIVDPKAVKKGDEIYELNRVMGKVDVDAVDGVVIVKAHGLESKMISLQTSLLDAEMVPKLHIVILSYGVQFLNEIVAALIVILLGVLTLGVHWTTLPFSQLVVMLIALRRVSPSLSNINMHYVMLNSQRKHIEVIDEVIRLTPLESQGSVLPGSLERVAFENVGFSYASGRNRSAIAEITFEMMRGQVTAVVGPTGSGKSTLVKLLMKLFPAQQGTIFADGTKLDVLSTASWRKLIGFVPQDTFLFHDTILQNIATWDDSISKVDIERAARLAQLHDFILTLPQGYETIVGDRGVRLSGGQAQRLAIARAVVRHPKLLIFDEATSSLDNLTERAIYEAIQSLRSDAIVLVVAHRLSTIKYADQIIVLQEGHIVEHGNHGELMSMNGTYAHLYGSEGHRAYAAGTTS